MRLRILIVADDPLARAGLAALLASQPDLIAAGQVDGNADLPAMLQVYQPDVVLWDMGWNPTLALERLADMRETITLPIVALLPDEAHAAQAWIAGARGLLLREVDAGRLTAALAAAAQGLMTLDPTLAAALMTARDVSPESLAEAPAEALTPRELEVLRLVAEGLPNKAIAQRLGISEHTVKFHLNAILGKLGVQSRTEAVVRATRLGLILL